MTISSRKESDVTLKKTREKLEELEKERIEKKNEYTQEKRNLEQRIIDVEIDKNNAIRNEKLLEERLRYLTEDKDKLERTLNDKFNSRLFDKDEVI